MADKLYNLRDLHAELPQGWDENRRQEYYNWAKRVCVNLYDADAKLSNMLQAFFESKNV